MKILIDECLPRKLKNELPGHEVKTVPKAISQGIAVDGTAQHQENHNLNV